jgi:transcriptional regulator with XRE-family HTH domain
MLASRQANFNSMAYHSVLSILIDNCGQFLLRQLKLSTTIAENGTSTSPTHGPAIPSRSRQEARGKRLELGITQSEAARQIGVSRQAFNQYISRKATPQAATLARACKKWGLTLEAEGMKLGAGSFGPVQANTDASQQLQLTGLFDEPQICLNENLIVRVEKSASALLQVTIRMRKAEPPRSRRARRAG